MVHTFSEAELNSLYRFSFALCDNSDTAFDLVHSAIEKLMLASDVVSPMAYARKIIKNLYIDQYRRDQKFHHQNIDEIEEFDVIRLGEESFEDVQLSVSMLNSCWSMLNPYERELLFLFCVEEYTAQELADEMDCSRGVILSKVHRIKKKVRTQLESPKVGKREGGQQ